MMNRARAKARLRKIARTPEVNISFSVIVIGGDARDEGGRPGCGPKKATCIVWMWRKIWLREIEHDLLAGPLHHVGLQEFEREGEGERAEIEAGEFGDAGGGIRAEVPAEPGVRAGGCEVGIDGDGDEEWAGRHRAGGLDEDGEARQAGLELVRAQVFDEPAHKMATVVDLADYVIVLLFSGRCGFGGLFSFRLPSVLILDALACWRKSCVKEWKYVRVVAFGCVHFGAVLQSQVQLLQLLRREFRRRQGSLFIVDTLCEEIDASAAMMRSGWTLNCRGLWIRFILAAARQVY